MKRAWNYVVTMWQPVSAFAVGCLLIAMLFFYRTGSLVSGAAPIEIATRTSSSSLKTIIDNPINAPYKVAQYAAHHLHKSILVERLVTGLAAGLTVLLFYALARRFMGRYATICATLLYATSSSLLNYGRLNSPQITLLLLLALFACGYYVRFSKHSRLGWFYGAAVVGIALYTPGLLYFIITGAFWQYRAFKRTRELPEPIVLLLGSSIILVLLLPLAVGFIRTPSLWHAYFGIPDHLSHIMAFLNSLAAVPLGLLVRAPANPIYRLGRQPVLDIFAGFMFIIGFYHLLRSYRLDRLLLLVGVFVLAIIYIAVSGNYENSLILLPFVYLIIGVGINHLMRDWNKVFPHNPLARWLALGTMTLAVLISSNFQAKRYFIAWPHNAETKAVFRLH